MNPELQQLHAAAVSAELHGFTGLAAALRALIERCK
jgi:hypothetical protein